MSNPQLARDGTLEHLPTFFRDAVRDLLVDLDIIHPDLNWQVFEGFRHPARQRWLLNETSSTKADMWESAHQFGLACDIVPGGPGNWTWREGPHWEQMRKAARERGLLTPYTWDLAHVVHPRWKKVHRAYWL